MVKTSRDGQELVRQSLTLRWVQGMQDTILVFVRSMGNILNWNQKESKGSLPANPDTTIIMRSTDCHIEMILYCFDVNGIEFSLLTLLDLSFLDFQIPIKIQRCEHRAGGRGS